MGIAEVRALLKLLGDGAAGVLRDALSALELYRPTVDTGSAGSDAEPPLVGDRTGYTGRKTERQDKLVDGRVIVALYDVARLLFRGAEGVGHDVGQTMGACGVRCKKGRRGPYRSCCIWRRTARASSSSRWRRRW